MKQLEGKTYLIPRDPPYPSNTLEVLLYKQAMHAITQEKVCTLFEQNGWEPPWFNGIYNYHHFHSEAHEVLAVTRGSISVQLGGPGGEIFHLTMGDIILLPAGVAHKRIESSEDYEIAGSYPSGQSPDLRKGSHEEWEEVLNNISKVKLWKKNPVTGD